LVFQDGPPMTLGNMHELDVMLPPTAHGLIRKCS
jgi:hypothetical protein